MSSATRESWKILPLAEARARIPYARMYSNDELAKLERGLVPREMEDKWFMFFERGELYVHRSWTGICIYVVRLDGNTVAEAWANRDPAQHRANDDASDARMLGFLVDRLLLGLAVPFPEAGASSLFVHHVVGHGRPATDD
jgi:hypothetical protein